MRLRTRICGMALLAPLLVCGGIVEASGAALPPGDREGSSAEELKPGETSGPVEVDGPSRNVLARQLALDAVAQKVRAIVDPSDEGELVPLAGGANNFSDMTIDPEQNRLDLWWKGSVPVQITDQLTLPEGATLVIHSAKFSLTELNSAARAVRSEVEATDLKKTYAIHSIAIRGRSDRVVLQVQPIGSSTLTPLRAAISKVTDVPIEVVAAGPNDGELRGQVGRQADATPWYGGGGMLLSFVDGNRVLLDRYPNSNVGWQRVCAPGILVARNTL